MFLGGEIMKKGLSMLLIVALIGTGYWGYTQSKENTNNRILLENQFQRMFQVMITDMENIQANLGKVMVTGTPKQNVLLFSDISQLSYDAQEKLGQLPIDQGNVSRTEKFLSQVGDLSKALARKNLEGKPLNEEDMSTLQELHNYSNYLAEQLIALQANMAENGMRLGELRKKANQQLKEVNENMLTTSFVNMEEKLQEYPELIYDGPFSEHISRKKPYLKGRTIQEEDLKKIAEEFIGNGTKYNMNILGEINNGRLPTYLVELQPLDQRNEDRITMSITKIAGKVVWMLDSRGTKEAKLSEKQGVELAQRFLLDKGYNAMIPTYSIKNDGEMVMNFAYSQDDMVIYSDLIKVKVGLDEGTIIGFEAEGYLFGHHIRDLNEPSVTEEEARNKISMNAEVDKPRLAVIPTEGGDEVLCYEFEAKFKEDTFLIYINAETGEEQKILQVIIKDNGVLML